MLQQSLFFFLSPGDRCIQSGFWEKTSRWYFCSVTFCLHLTQYSCTSFKHSKPLRVSFLCGWAILDQPIFIEGKTILLDSSYSWARAHGGVIALREIHSGTTRFYNSNCRLFFFSQSLWTSSGRLLSLETKSELLQYFFAITLWCNVGLRG